MLIGLLTLAAVGPLAAIIVAVISHSGGIDAVVTGIVPDGVRPIAVGPRNQAALAFVLGAFNVIALAIDS